MSEGRTTKRMRTQDLLCDEAMESVLGVSHEMQWLQVQLLASHAKQAALEKQVRYRDQMIAHLRTQAGEARSIEKALRRELRKK